MKWNLPAKALVASTLIVGSVQAQSVDSAIYETAVFGINRSTGQLSRYDFDTQTAASIGAVHLGSVGAAMPGIDGSAYVPGFQNIFAFWTDPADNKTKLIYVDTETARATLIGQPLEGGHITGAVAVPGSTAGSWDIMAMQLAEVTPDFTVTGLVSINPNNSPHSEFTVTTANGGGFTRDQLHQNSITDANGTYYEGEATLIRFKPKGNGNQNGLIIDGQTYPLQNSNTYILSGNMTISVYNDNLNGNNKCMGHWWLEIVSGNAHFVADVAMGTVDRLVKVNHFTGVVNEIMTVDRPYDSLGSSDGQMFYATLDDELYRIDSVNMTETLVGSLGSDDVNALELVGSSLLGFGMNQDMLTPYSTSAQFLGSPAALGMYDLGSIVFMPLAQDPAAAPDAFD
jgi:hypothetical protein